MKLSLELIVKKITRGQTRVAARGRSDQEPMRLTELRLYCGEGPGIRRRHMSFPGNGEKKSPPALRGLP